MPDPQGDHVNYFGFDLMLFDVFQSKLDPLNDLPHTSFSKSVKEHEYT